MFGLPVAQYHILVISSNLESLIIPFGISTIIRASSVLISTIKLDKTIDPQTKNRKQETGNSLH